LLCDGNIDRFFQVETKMTWLEEWIFYFEFVYGRVHTRWEDMEAAWNTTTKPLRRVVCSKLAIALACRQRWPMYASYEEDAELRNHKWNEYFDPKTGERVVMHDATNIPFMSPTDAAQQRAMWSDYYGMCCAKTGISNQLCSWIRGMPLFTGRLGDSNMVRDSGIMPQQKDFAEMDQSSQVPFLNVFDKGFRNAIEADQAGQRVLQPIFSKGDKQFNRNEVLHTAAVAHIRSGNERAVGRCKMSWFVKRGCMEQAWDIDLLCDVWEAWTFQVNFMYDKYL
jgi:hypothetical protein